MMAGIKMYDYQMDAIANMHKGCILCGGVGSGKSRTSLAYFYRLHGGQLNTDNYIPMKATTDLYIITTARKRDTFEWDDELIPFRMSTKPELNDIYPEQKVIIDSWNNIKKYEDVKDGFFIFDEQRVVGKGQWVKSFLKIAKNNFWILLSATPGDRWEDYIPVFIANGFYHNRSQFNREHVIFSPYCKNFPKVQGYVNTERLIRLRNKILVNMHFERKTIPHNENIYVGYDRTLYKDVMRNRWNPYEKKPIENVSELCYILRKVVNSDSSRIEEVEKIVQEKGKAIIFYNFDYELELLKYQAYYGCYCEIAEWNGHAHQPIPDSNNWVYLVQYNAGAEGWNCIKTDTIIFYSQNYSYKMMQQAAGRIDRLNTPYTDLYFYHIKSRASIDLGIARALEEKKEFNQNKWCKGMEVKV